MVSFNNDAETSHGKVQGENAPTSEAAAFAYGAALNALLARGSDRNLLIGDATAVFWPRTVDPAAEVEIEDAFAASFQEGDVRDSENASGKALRERVTSLAQGKVPDGTALDPAARVFVLGLAPNAARIAIRFRHVDALGSLARRIRRFWEECAISPSPFRRGDAERMPRPPSLLYDIAALRERKNIPPNLAGSLMQAVLTGLPYPATLLPAVIARLRAEGDPDRKRYGDVDGRRAALIRAVLIRNLRREIPMALSETEDNVAYLLGRLFGAYVYAERSYQERGASLRSKYMGSASATPAKVFPILMRGYVHNLNALTKAGGNKTGSGIRAEKAVAAITALMPGDALPATLPLEDQGRFFIGFYHQISAFYTKAEDA
ncbi:MAG: type I-C CRISPR-associated protein Cas8c/Csd1, partial [Pseudomonadota bacterium]